MKELVAYAKANPGKLNYASVGPGSSSHLNGELLKSLAGIDIVHIPFNGSPPAVTSTVQGETQMIFAVMQPLQPQIQAGKLRALAVTSAKRFPLLPDLPTIAESGYPKFESLAWNGVLVPAGTPKPVIARLNAEINAILKMPDVVQKLNAAGFDLDRRHAGGVRRADQGRSRQVGADHQSARTSRSTSSDRVLARARASAPSAARAATGSASYSRLRRSDSRGSGELSDGCSKPGPRVGR